MISAFAFRIRKNQVFSWPYSLGKGLPEIEIIYKQLHNTKRSLEYLVRIIQYKNECQILIWHFCSLYYNWHIYQIAAYLFKIYVRVIPEEITRAPFLRKCNLNENDLFYWMRKLILHVIFFEYDAEFWFKHIYMHFKIICTTYIIS